MRVGNKHPQQSPPGKEGCNRTFTQIFTYAGIKGYYSGEDVLLIKGNIIFKVGAKKLLSICLSRQHRDGRFFKEVFLPLAKIIAYGYRGYSYLHAALLRNPDGDIFIFPGNSGSGKTTISKVLLESCWHCLSDDSILIRETGTGFVLLPYRRTIKISDNKKINKIFIKGLKRIIILFPEVEKKTSVLHLNDAEAMGLLMRCSAHMLTIPQLAQKQMGMLSDLIEIAECYRIQLGRDMLRDRRVLLTKIESIKMVT